MAAVGQGDAFQLLTSGVRFAAHGQPRRHRDATVEANSDATSTGTARPLRPRRDFFQERQALNPADRIPAAAAKPRADGRKKKGAPAAPTRAVTEEGSKELPPARIEEDEVLALRKRHRIFIKGSDVPPPLTSFGELATAPHNVPPPLLETLLQQYSEPTPIQAQGIPALLADRDVLGVAPTGKPIMPCTRQHNPSSRVPHGNSSSGTGPGSGKTLAFAVPVLADLKAPGKEGFRACVVAPTRELAQQIKQEMDALNTKAKLQIRLLTKANTASGSLKSNQRLDVLVATPMRLVYALQHNLLDLSNVRWLVIDEADRLFENGFEHQIDEVIAACTHKQRRIALFSATMPQRVEELAQSVLDNYIRIVVGAAHAASSSIQQTLTFVGGEDGKMPAMRQLLQQGLEPPVLIFVQSKSRAKELFNELVYENVHVDAIHADRTQQQRDEVVKGFREGKVWVLICTDLMARGVDFKGVNMVINYDFPPNATEYIHRVGRTGRAGRKGRAITFFTAADAPLLRSIASVVKEAGSEVAPWMLELKKKKKGQRSRTVERAPISSDPKAVAKSKQRAKRRHEQRQEANTANTTSTLTATKRGKKR